MRALRAGAVCAILILAGCGPSQQDRGLTEEEINALGLGANKSVAAEPTPATIGLETLEPGDLTAANLRPICMLRVGGEPVLAAEQYRALVSRHGRKVDLRVEGPVGATGGFFQNDAISVSVGRPYDRAEPDQVATGPARARLNDRRRGTSNEVDADWSCGN
ncbi:MAG: hypothetical protein ACK4SZ_03910 [Allosphingosinicella sp.]|uniref:hypothetical protein n=1 Tax=Allosphingosinicella sp. TaxID=2823234 RepID=UPI00394E04B4